MKCSGEKTGCQRCKNSGTQCQYVSGDGRGSRRKKRKADEKEKASEPDNDPAPSLSSNDSSTHLSSENLTAVEENLFEALGDPSVACKTSPAQAVPDLAFLDLLADMDMKSNEDLTMQDAGSMMLDNKQDFNMSSMIDDNFDFMSNSMFRQYSCRHLIPTRLTAFQHLMT